MRNYIKNNWAALIVLSIGIATVILGGYSVSVILPRMRGNFYPSHTLAIMTIAGAFMMIAFGIVVTAVWLASTFVRKNTQA